MICVICPSSVIRSVEMDYCVVHKTVPALVISVYMPDKVHEAMIKIVGLNESGCCLML